MSATPLLCKTLARLLESGSIPHSSLSRQIRESSVIASLLDAKAVVLARQGGGRAYRVAKRDVVEEYRKHYCPNAPHNPHRGVRHNQIRQSRDSKAKARESYRLAFFRSYVDFHLNGEVIHGDTALLFGDKVNRLEVSKLCVIENLETFMENTFLLQEGWVLLHPYGRMGDALFGNIQVEQVLHYGDLDFSGLNEYARIRKFFPQAKLYLPDNYRENLSVFGKKIDTNQTPDRALLSLEKTDPVVAELMALLRTHRRFLEQEGYDDA